MAWEVQPEVLLGMVTGGVSAVLLLTVALGWNKEVALDRERALRRFAQDFEGSAAREVLVADDGRSALLDLGENLGLVVVLGDRLVTRMLRGGQRVVEASGDRLRIAFPDLGLPQATVVISDGAARADWLQRLRGRRP